MTSEWGQANEPLWKPIRLSPFVCLLLGFEIGSLEALAKPGEEVNRVAYLGGGVPPPESGAGQEQRVLRQKGIAAARGIPLKTAPIFCRWNG